MTKLFRLLQKAFQELQRNDPLRLAAATAFFTSFALPAILIILIQTLGMVFSRRTVGLHMLEHLSDIIGPGTVQDLRKTLRNVRHLATSWYIATGGFLFLIFVATTLFKVIKDSLNQLWDIRVIDKPGVMFALKLRIRSFIVILLAGFLFTVVMLAEASMAVLKEYLQEVWRRGHWVLDAILNQAISIAVVTTWFAVLFRFLPDGRPQWKVAFTGGFFTALLFTCGKLILGFLLSYSNMQTIYGASTSMVLMLLFVFYSSFIFYYGACFTKVWAQHVNAPIKPGKYAVHYEQKN
jgi:Predicted membrane protein